MSAPTAENKTDLGRVVLGRYRIVRALASGGMGTVYLARNEGAAGFVKPVVIKQSLRAGGGVADQLFAREARILSSLRHPSVVGIVDFAEDDGDYIMVLDYVHGYTLSQWSRFVRKTRGRMPVELAVYVTLQMLEGLHYAHTLRDSRGSLLGIVHRDVKPSNVLIDVQGLVKLADFGVARTNTEATDTSTGDTTLKGTFSFMAPELFGGAEPSPASDVFSASVTLYQLLAGRNPFSTGDAVLTAARTLQHDPDPIGDVRDDVNAQLANAVHRGMCKHAGGRFESAKTLADALRAAVPDGETSGPAFRAAIEEDFHDPLLPELLRIDSLEEREKAWSMFGNPGELPSRLTLPLSPSEIENAQVERALRSGALSAGAGGDPDDDGATSVLADDAVPARIPAGDSRPTVVEEPDLHTVETVLLGDRSALAGVAKDEAKADEPAPAAGRSKRPLVLAVAVAVAGVGAGAVLLLADRGGGDEGKQTVVMVRGDVTMDDGSGDESSPRDPEPAADPETPAPDTDPEDPPATGTAGTPTPRPPSVADALTARFRRRQALITRCFDRYREEAIRAGEIAVRFHVDVEGAVVRAQLYPASVEGQPLGGCLLEVARATRFGPQAEPVTFRIPIRVRGQ